jgi:predicted dehydrogenase
MVHSVAIVGFGSAGRRALNVLRDFHPDARFLIVTREAIDQPNVTGTNALDDVLDFNPDVVVVAGPATLRKRTVEALASARASFFLEKPLAHSLADATTLARIIGNSTRSQVGYNLRFSSSLSYFRDHVHASTFGHVLSVRAETGQYLPDWRPGSDYRESVSARDDLGGGVLRELSHELDYLRWIFGPIEWVSGWAGRTSNLDIDVDDTALVTLGFEGSGPASPLIGTAALDFVRRDRTRSVTAVCEEGTLRWDGIAGRVEVWRAGAVEWERLMTDAGTAATYRAQWEYFLADDDDQASPAATVDDGVEVLRLVEAIELSHSRRGARVALTDVESHS